VKDFDATDVILDFFLRHRLVLSRAG
jgi:hypothetical protein